jgi:hypothetical protein
MMDTDDERTRAPAANLVPEVLENFVRLVVGSLALRGLTSTLHETTPPWRTSGAYPLSKSLYTSPSGHPRLEIGSTAGYSHADPLLQTLNIYSGTAPDQVPIELVQQAFHLSRHRDGTSAVALLNNPQIEGERKLEALLHERAEAITLSVVGVSQSFPDREGTPAWVKAEPVTWTILEALRKDEPKAFRDEKRLRASAYRLAYRHLFGTSLSRTGKTEAEVMWHRMQGRDPLAPGILRTLPGLPRTGEVPSAPPRLSPPPAPEPPPRPAKPKTAKPSTAEPRTAEPRTAEPRTAGPRTARKNAAEPTAAKTKAQKAHKREAVDPGGRSGARAGEREDRRDRGHAPSGLGQGWTGFRPGAAHLRDPREPPADRNIRPPYDSSAHVTSRSTRSSAPKR